jgi:hypothetical protein
MKAATLLRERADIFARLSEIDRQLATLASSEDSAPYSSKALPPGIRTRSAFARACRGIPEAKRDGKLWIVSRDAWERRKRQSTPAPAPTHKFILDELGVQ